jgi:hypothetical protein
MNGFSLNFTCGTLPEICPENSNLVKKKSYPITGLDRPLGAQEVEAPRYLSNRHMKVVRLSALRTGCLYLQKILLILISVGG